MAMYTATINDIEHNVEASTYEEAAQAMAERFYLPGYAAVRLEANGTASMGPPSGRRFTAWCRGGEEGAKNSGGLDGPGIDGRGNRGAAREILTGSFNVYQGTRAQVLAHPT